MVAEDVEPMDQTRLQLVGLGQERTRDAQDAPTVDEQEPALGEVGLFVGTRADITEIKWVQEEPANMGPWFFVREQLFGCPLKTLML